MIAFTSEQEQFRKAVARFVDAEVVPEAEAIDDRAEFPMKLFKRIGELGYLGLRYPEAYGGAGADMVTYCLFAEELARLIPGAEIKLFPRGGHFLTQVQAREFNNAVLPFLVSHTPA